MQHLALLCHVDLVCHIALICHVTRICHAAFVDLQGLELGLNPVALVAVGTILLVYIIGVIFCRRLDQLDLRRISVVPLCGRDGVFKYHITVITGRQIGAGEWSPLVGLLFT